MSTIPQSTTPRTDAARGFHDMDTAVSAEDMAKLETELAAAKKRIADCEFVMAHRYDIIERQEPRCNEANARAEKAEFDLAHARVMLRVLRDALENLRDEQNGAPLCTQEEEWKQAMDRADAALAQTKEASK